MRTDINFECYRALLLEKQAQVVKGLQGIKDSTFSESLKERTGEDSTYDQHSADLALETFEREKDLGIKDGLEIDKAKIALALDRIEKGTYGNCLRCGNPIPEGRLQAVPEAELCIHCQREQEEIAPASRRPVEEDTPRLGVYRGFELLADDVNPEGDDRAKPGTDSRPKGSPGPVS